MSTRRETEKWSNQMERIVDDMREREAEDRLHPTAGSEARAEVIKRITGMVASIEVGEFVRVTRIDGTTCTVERETWRGSMVTLNNCIVGAPLNHLKFCPQNVQGDGSPDTQPNQTR